MHIALDLDNTLLDTTEACLRFFNQIGGTELSAVDDDYYRFYEFYGWNEEMYETVYERYGHDIHWSTKPYPNAVEAARDLFGRHQITILTARPKLFSTVTIEWLGHHRVPYHNIVFAIDKFDTCQAMNVDVLVDDAPHYAREFSSKGRRFVIVDQPYNRHVHHDLIHRLTAWTDAGEMLNRIQC